MHPHITKTPYAEYWIEEGIMHVVWSPNLVITIDIAIEMVEERIRLCKGKALPLLIDIRGLASIDTASRKYFACEKSISITTGGALLVESLVSRLAGNIYITVDKPQRPIKLFTNKDKAIQWLKKLKK